MRPRPAPALLLVTVLLLLEAALLVGAGIAFGVSLTRGTETVPGATVFLMLFCWGVAALLVLAVRAVRRGRRWGRSLAVTWQILLVVLSLGWLGAEVTWWAVGVLVVAVVTGIGLLLPSVTGSGPGGASVMPRGMEH